MSEALFSAATSEAVTHLTLAPMSGAVPTRSMPVHASRSPGAPGACQTAGQVLIDALFAPCGEAGRPQIDEVRADNISKAIESMTSPAPAPQDTAFVVPERLTLLGQAVGPVARAARQSLVRKVLPSGCEFVLLEDAIRHMGVIQAALEHLSLRLDGLMTNVVSNDKATSLEVGREAGRLEQVLSEFVDGFLEVKASHADPNSSHARTLVMGVYRHHARSVCRWLEEMSWVMCNPEAAIRQRGLAGSTDVVFTINLNMTTPPQMAALHALSRQLRESFEAQNTWPPQQMDPPEAIRATGVLETIGALAFGLGFTKAVLGRRGG